MYETIYLYKGVRVSVCMLAYNSGTGGAIVSKFLGSLQHTPGIFLGAKSWGNGLR